MILNFSKIKNLNQLNFRFCYVTGLVDFSTLIKKIGHNCLNYNDECACDMKTSNMILFKS